MSSVNIDTFSFQTWLHMIKYTYSINGLVLKILKISSNEVSDNGFGFVNLFIPRVCDFDFKAITNLRNYTGSDRENRSVCNFTPFVIREFTKSRRQRRLQRKVAFVSEL